MNYRKVNPLSAILILIFLGVTGICILHQRYFGIEFIQYSVIYTLIVTLGFIVQHIYRINQKNRFEMFNEEVINIDTDYFVNETLEPETND
jgi:hypothetical protein